MNRSFWKGRRVFVTGHTGFKGAWLAIWLRRMGAEVTGYALPPEGTPNLWSLLGQIDIGSVTADLNDRDALQDALGAARPEVILHLAAQALVRRSYRDPVGTFASNVMGTVNLLDAARACPDLRAVVIATSDKAYENTEQIWGYREGDALGGRDPYSGSKGAADIAASSMARSYFLPGNPSGHPARVAIVRAGNVIGGGDWSEDRLVPDIVRGCLGPEGRVTLRAPRSVRPWQHVLEPLRGYLMVAERLVAGDDLAATGWNFGPDRRDERAVVEVAEAMVAALGCGRLDIAPAGQDLHEARVLRLDSTRAERELGWRPVTGFGDCVRLTADWYAGWAAGRAASELCDAQLNEYEELLSDDRC
ncbi:CDP-glucose 4,6-dehydratase [Defluviimonas sp. WL0050]|uniref:CDP-glucose 4,6-dehydratase n=1 Tax=Albidovulum litorale TaxID=2984134 RepID=A0ABT2ZI25_9RHOB|nr:CDP-glucose 4,6-dehydratase [Defluviimonas sp. WL0050]MCV2870693.1 CDP-glucose 4,6-dehydratase [Defluviimonas sp. WL0050]